MALTRKMLKAMGIEDEKIDQIIEAHTDVTDSLKADRDKYKADAEKLADVQKKYESLKQEADSREDDPYKEKYAKEHKAFEEFKASVKAEQTKASKTKAYKDLLKKAGVSDKRIDSILKVTALDEISLDDDGSIKDADKVVDSIKSEWADFIVSESTKGAGTENPPKNVSGNKLTLQDIYKKDEHGRYVMDTAERQKALVDMSAGK